MIGKVVPAVGFALILGGCARDCDTSRFSGSSQIDCLNSTRSLGLQFIEERSVALVDAGVEPSVSINIGAGTISYSVLPPTDGRTFGGGGKLLISCASGAVLEEELFR